MNGNSLLLCYSDMKKRSLVGLLLFLLAFHSKAQDTCVETKDIYSEEKAHATARFNFLESGDPRFSYDMKYCRMDLRVNPSKAYISGSITMHFNTDMGGYYELGFNMFSGLNIDSAVYHGKQISTYKASSDRLFANLPSILPANTLDSITLYFQGVPSSSMGGFMVGQHAGIPILWTLSEPYASKDWWPCKQSLDDKIDSTDIFITCPKENLAGSIGLLVSSVSNDSEVTHHWKSNYPIVTYLIGITVSQYEEFTTYAKTISGDSFPVLSYVYQEDLSSALSTSATLLKMIANYTNLFGDYPFAKEKYGHAQFNRGGGMEHQTMSFIHDFNFPLVSHELAHQWFGDKLTCGSWKDIWLNEGFANYCEGLSEEFINGKQSFQNFLMKDQARVLSQPDGSVYVDDTTRVNRIFDSRLTYCKGGMLLHMLRYLLGDSLFFKGIKNYLNDTSLAYRFSRTEHLKQHLESVSGLDLSYFFKTWFYGQGYPFYSLIWKQRDHVVSIRLGQTTSHKSVPYYLMPLEVLFQGDGRDTLIKLDADSLSILKDIELPFAVKSVVLDPNRWVLARYKVANEDSLIPKPLKVVPNPAQKLITIKLNNQPLLPTAKVTVVDMLGKEASVQIVSMNADDLRLNIETLAQGVYQLLITDGAEAYKCKLMVLRP